MQQALVTRQQAAVGQFRPLSACSHHGMRYRTIVFAEGPGAKPVREFREDTGEVSVPGEKSQQQQTPGGPIYADQVAMVSHNLAQLIPLAWLAPVW
jgi:hypothetical protein